MTGKKKSYHKVYEEWYGVVIPDGYDIHHADFNHFNDNPLNLVMLTHSDHSRLHMKRKVDTNVNWRKAHNKRMEGNEVWKGKKHKSSSVEAIRESSRGNTNTKGRVWVCDGVTSKMVNPGEIPVNFRKGRLMNKNLK